VTADSAVWAYDGQTHRKESWTTVNGDKLLAGHVFDIAISTNSAVTTPAEGVVSNAFDHVRIVDADGADRTRNYNLFVYEGTLQVTNAPIGPTMALHRTVEAVYDGQAHSAAVEPPSLLTPPTVRYRVGDGDWTAEAPAWTHAGTYTAQFEVSAQFYDPATGTVQVAISPRPLTVRADAKSKVYGDADPELTYSVSNLVEGDSVSGALTREAGEAEGTYRILQGTLTAGSNYEIAFTGANFKITKRNVSVRPASWSKTYGEPDPEFTAEVTGLANGDTATVIFSRTEGEDVGEYEIRIDRVEFSGGNYRVSVKTAKLTIVPRPATVRAVDASKVFGAADPSLEWKSDDLIGDDTLAGSPIRDPGEAVGEYAIRIGSLTNPNYAVSFVDGVFEILPGGIVVDASAGALGYTGEYDGAAHGAALRVKNPATGATVQWSATAGGPWANASPTFVDAGTNTVWWRVTAPNFDPLAGTAQIAIAPRPISKASVGVLTNEYYTGYPVEPVPSVTDTVPITADDWSVAWEDNVEVGRARAIVTGRGNYCGEAVREFEIVLKPIVVIVIDLSSVDVGQGKWGTASLATNGVPVDIAAGSRVELELPQGTPVALSFAPDPGFKIGSVIVDRRTWSTQAEWAFEAKADRAFQASYIPNPQTTVRWKLATATGHYHAQLAFPVYPGYEEALAGLKFHFADRVQDGKTYAQLWDYTVPTTAGRHLADEEELDGKKYRFVPLDASKMAGLAAGSRVVYGVTDATLASATAAVPQAQRLIGLYIQKRVSPVSGQETDAGVENFIGAFSWETNGKTYYQPVGEGYPTGVIAEKILDAEDLDAADALGFDPAFLAIAEPACRFTDFAIDPVRGIGGAFEIYAATPDGIEAVSAGTTANAAFRLWGTERLGGEWVELDRAVFPGESGGTVRFSDTEANVGEFRFFRATIEVRASHE
ncbi:MAG: hypothetical protein IJV65_06145, partial [Kiritimatiellae bacterium]|nr:hypothetical protein [Kiritimatiellia bacterium]